MFRFIWTLSVRTRYFLRRYMPSNILLGLIRTRNGLKWGLPVMMLTAPYLGVAIWCTGLIDNGGPGWLHLIVLWACWNALKMIAIGPVSVVLLVRARTQERRARKCVQREIGAGMSQPELTRSNR